MLLPFNEADIHACVSVSNQLSFIETTIKPVEESTRCLYRWSVRRSYPVLSWAMLFNNIELTVNSFKFVQRIPYWGKNTFLSLQTSATMVLILDEY